jgi:hypothetical protein
MPKFIMVVQTNAADDRHDEFNDWYTNQHVPDILALDGFSAAQRFRRVDPGADKEGARRYLAIYEVEADSMDDVQKTMGTAMGTDAMKMHDSFDAASAQLWFYEPLGDRVAPD